MANREQYQKRYETLNNNPGTPATQAAAAPSSAAATSAAAAPSSAAATSAAAAPSAAAAAPSVAQMPPQAAVEAVLPAPVNIKQLESLAKKISKLFFETEQILRVAYNEANIQLEPQEMDRIISAYIAFDYAFLSKVSSKSLNTYTNDAIASIDSFIKDLESTNQDLNEKHKITSNINFLKLNLGKIEKYTTEFLESYPEPGRGGKRKTRRKRKAKKTKKHRR